MTENVRCPSCRGAKKVPKLGGIIGECNTCKGKGTILASDKPKPVVSEVLPNTVDIVKAVSDSVPASTVEVVELDVKIDPKRALYKRKKA